MKSLAKNRKEIEKAVVELRRHLHGHPETAYEEHETAALIASRMSERGFTVRKGLGKTGVMAVLDTGKPGKTVLLRADMDALPIKEETGLAFAATNGKMHACGHDGHIAALDAAADLLALDPPAQGKIVFAFQPAEEASGGSLSMIADGVLSNPKVDAAFGIHLWTSLPLGTIGVRNGPMMAAVDEFEIEIAGSGGHGASPHETRDPVVAAAHVILALQTIPSRRIAPVSPVVVSVTSIHSGSAFNVIPETAVLRGTCRSFEKIVWDRLPALFEETAQSAARVLGCSARVKYIQLSRAVINHRDEAELVQREGIALVGRDGIIENCHTMGGEDFAAFLERVPGAFIFVGAAKPEHGLGPAHHSPHFDFDERALMTAAELHSRVARAYLAEA
ncbi:MAG: amidohydrolase [Acidobacteria bacterium]|nr:amidohydrolase [Acidobacteriota bacterium]MCG3194211.1 putative hydrolase YxeP [Thermoanaerobaculia bacterium]MCK6681291.1 M20 family metallopeptidase [Thermoanaerobaculia bacterium]